MSIQIFYFSGTGNSLAAAMDIENSTDAQLMPIASLRDQTTLSLNSDAVGIVFPVYYGELPVIVKEFAEKLANLQEKYVFAVCTHGGAAMASLRVLKKILRNKGCKNIAAFGVHMPQNSFLKPKEDKAKILSAWNKKRDFIVNNISRKARGTFYHNLLIELLIIPFQQIVRSACRKSFLNQTGLPTDTPMDDLIRNLDRSFATDQNCSGCGICEKVCPVGNIEIKNGRPEWLHRCENCLACVNWCPNQAIQGGITSGFFYTHPQIKIADIERQKNPNRIKNHEERGNCDA